MKPDAHAQFSVDVVRINNDAVVAHRLVDAGSTTSTFDFPAPGDARVQFHLSGAGDRSLFQQLTFAYLGPTP
jgi:hypothetical protein